MIVTLSARDAGSSVPVRSEVRQEPRFEGEYGLFVGLTEAGLEVRWLTDDTVAGVARAFVEGKLVDEATTKHSDAHVAQLAVAGPLVTLEYGAASGGALYRTAIRLEPPAPADIEPIASDSIYLFGDVHGEFDRIKTLLEGAGLIDEEGHWQGGSRTVGLLGDLFDRGDDVTRLLWFLYRLEAEAHAVGGQVIVVLGNHEVMVMAGDLRYVGGKEAALGFRHRKLYSDLFDPHTSILGQWLASKPGLVRMGDLLLAHGGVSPTYVDYSLGAFRDTLQSFMAESLFVRWNDPPFLERFAQETTLDSAGVGRRYEFFFGPSSVLWYRGFVLADTLNAHLDKVLKRFDAAVHVVAHTPVETIQERYDGRLIAVDLVDAASEMLLLVRESDGWGRFKISLDGETQRLTP